MTTEPMSFDEWLAYWHDLQRSLATWAGDLGATQ